MGVDKNETYLCILLYAIIIMGSLMLGLAIAKYFPHL